MFLFPSLPLCGKVVFLLSHDTQALRNNNVLIPLLNTLWHSSFFLLGPDTQALRNHKVRIPLWSCFLWSSDSQALRNHNVLFSLLTTLWHSSFSLLSPDTQALRNPMFWFLSWLLCDTLVFSIGTWFSSYRNSDCPYPPLYHSVEK